MRRLWFEKVYTEDYSKQPYTAGYKLGLFWRGPKFSIRTVFMIPIEHRHLLGLCRRCDHWKLVRCWIDTDEPMPETKENMHFCASFVDYCKLSPDGKGRKLLKMPMHCPFFELK